MFGVVVMMARVSSPYRLALDYVFLKAHDSSIPGATYSSGGKMGVKKAVFVSLKFGICFVSVCVCAFARVKKIILSFLLVCGTTVRTSRYINERSERKRGNKI